jgi:hypothetical protein|tara:strand:+ start:596 stop:721 length:126 start_codon:yes stop_codon:yes gene_type:complete
MFIKKKGGLMVKVLENPVQLGIICNIFESSAWIVKASLLSG